MLLPGVLEKDPNYQSPGTSHQGTSNGGVNRFRLFPSDASLLRLVGSILIDINEEWITGSRYLSLKSEMISLDTEADFTAI